ncbi:MAG: MGMT family protein, partial [candidate division WOR-3 bacterium]
ISELRQYFKTGWSDFGWFEIPKFALLLKPEEVVRAFVFLKDNVRPGQLITYNELADIVGAEPPVLRAHIQNNRLPVIIPCHRVIRSDGRMGGYQRGHDDKKYWLLKLEGIRFKGDIW